jgi:hypothetical protein
MMTTPDSYRGCACLKTSLASGQYAPLSEEQNCSHAKLLLTNSDLTWRIWQSAGAHSRCMPAASTSGSSAVTVAHSSASQNLGSDMSLPGTPIRSASSPPLADRLLPMMIRKGNRQPMLMTPTIQNAGQPSVADLITTCKQDGANAVLWHQKCHNQVSCKTLRSIAGSMAPL